MTAKADKFYEAIISSAYSLKTRGFYGSDEKALNALVKRKPVKATGISRAECEEYFRLALKVVDDALEFEKRYLQGNEAKKTASGWINKETIEDLGRKMEEF